MAKSGLFDNLRCYVDFEAAVVAYGKLFDDELYNDRVGESFEVYTEYFFARFGKETTLGVGNITDTSQNKFERGLDFFFYTHNNERGVIQSKYRSDPTYKFNFSSLQSLMSVCYVLGIPIENQNRRVVFTNLSHQVSKFSNGIFDDFDGKTLQSVFQVIGREAQEFFEKRHLDFWSEFAKSLKSSLKVQKFSIPEMREHQVRMHDAGSRIMKLEFNRGKFICATGGGKTRVEYQLLHDGFFKHDLKIQVIVAPTINLLIQHHTTFHNYGMFNDGVQPLGFRTGDDPRDNTQIDYEQTTNEEELLDLFKKYHDKKIQIFLTYKSERKFFEILRRNDFVIDTVIWDEFHHTVKQSYEYRKYLLAIPATRNLFFSASEKRGRILNSFTDADVYGECFANVTYSELRQKGILVPNIIIKPLRLTAEKMQAIPRELIENAKKRNFDAKVAHMEGAAILVARKDQIFSVGRSNILTFGKSTEINKEIATSKAMRNSITGNTLLQAVHAGTKGIDRKKIFESIKTSNDSVLAQHSIVKEGTDITAFSSLIFSRELEETGTQQGIGRIVRAEPEDTENLRLGKISLDDPKGWKKYSATVYVIMHDEKIEDFNTWLKEFIKKLQFAGLGENDYHFMEVNEERHGKEVEEFGWVTKIADEFDINEKVLNDYAKKLCIEIQDELEKEEEHEVELEKSRKKSLKQLVFGS